MRHHRPFPFPDSFKKVIVVKDSLMPHYDDGGFLVMGLGDFLLDETSLK